jgi:hypothetical protein
MMTAPAIAGGAPRALLKTYAVKVTLANGQRLEYRALAACSVSALQDALEAHGINRIVIRPRRNK